MKAQYVLISSFLILGGCFSKNKGVLNLVNRSNESISRLNVSICNETLEFLNLKSGAVVSGSYTIKGDCHFEITVQFDSGKKIEKKYGYVTNGFDYSHQIEISDSMVKVEGGVTD